jgi:hypothetical protein
VACWVRAGEGGMNTSGIEILSGQDNAEQRNISALQLRDRNALNFGLVLFKDRDELFVARILFANALFVRKGNIRNAALLRFAAVFHNEMDTIADNDSHRIDPRTSASLIDGGLPCPAQASGTMAEAFLNGGWHFVGADATNANF